MHFLKLYWEASKTHFALVQLGTFSFDADRLRVFAGFSHCLIRFGTSCVVLRCVDTGEDHFLESKKPMCLWPLEGDCCSDPFARIGAAWTTAVPLKGLHLKDPGEHGCWLKVSSPAWSKKACCQSLPNRHVVWVLLLQAFAAWGWVRCWLRCDIPGGMPSSASVFAVDRFATIGRRTAQFCFGLLMRCLFSGSPPSPP